MSRMYLETRESDRPVLPSSVQASEQILPHISAGQSLIAEYRGGAETAWSRCAVQERFLDDLGIRVVVVQELVIMLCQHSEWLIRCSGTKNKYREL